MLQQKAFRKSNIHSMTWKFKNMDIFRNKVTAISKLCVSGGQRSEKLTKVEKKKLKK
jgi:hypothetical protein